MVDLRRRTGERNRHGSGGRRHLAFEVEDIGEAVADLAGNGVVAEPSRVDPQTGKRCTFFADPDGLPLELYDRRVLIRHS